MSDHRTREEYIEFARYADFYLNINIFTETPRAVRTEVTRACLVQNGYFVAMNLPADSGKYTHLWHTVLISKN